MNHPSPFRIVAALGASLLLAGCAGTPPAPDAARTHPANPNAEASALPRLETGLLDMTNVAVFPSPATQPEIKHPHGHQP